MARRVGRWRTTVPTSPQSKGRLSKAKGPSRYAESTISPATAAPAEAPPITPAAPSPSTPSSRYGVAFPIVRAPTIVPMARPRPSRNQVAAIFIAGGYTPARNTPVRNRRIRPAPNPGAASSKPLASAAARAEAANRVLARTMSARLRSADSAVPTTKPSCTPLVSHTSCVEDRPHTSRRCGDTALAVNQRDMPASSAADSSARILQRPAGSPDRLNGARLPRAGRRWRGRCARRRGRCARAARGWRAASARR